MSKSKKKQEQQPASDEQKGPETENSTPKNEQATPVSEESTNETEQATTSENETETNQSPPETPPPDTNETETESVLVLALVDDIANGLHCGQITTLPADVAAELKARNVIDDSNAAIQARAKSQNEKAED